MSGRGWAWWLLIVGLIGLWAATTAWTGASSRRVLKSHAHPAWEKVTVLAGTREARTALVRQGFLPDDVDLRRGTVTFTLSAAERQRLQRLGWPIVRVRPLDFPPWDAAYHNYAETVADIHAVADAFPDIVAVTTYGTSVEGRPLYAVKISDNVRQDESDREPGVLFFANIHAREHLSAEQALWIVHYLAENYGRDPAVTNLVATREIWVMPMTNPDGVEYDIRRYPYAWWRKNRRRNPDGSVGVDLNRNFGYRWGCCGGSSGIPSRETYRGPYPFSEPETQALRAFFLAHPNIRVSLNFHTYSELVLWPYGYTYEDVPPDMDPVDHAVLVRAGMAMARLSGYTAMQASDLYIADGTSDDWVYGVLRVPTWTVELYPPAGPNSPGFYPPDEFIPEQTARNRALVTYLIALADEPRKVIGRAGDLITPTVTLAVTAPSPALSSLVTATVTVSDNVGATTVAVLVDDRVARVVTPATVQPRAVFTLPVSLPPGEHVLTAVAYDRAHHRGVSAGVRVRREEATGRLWVPAAWVRRTSTAAPGPPGQQAPRR